MYAGFEHSPDLSPRQSQLVIGLQSRPDFRGNSEKPTKPQSRIGGDRPPPVNDLADAARRYVDFPRKLINAQVERLDEILKENFSRMDGVQQLFCYGIFFFLFLHPPPPFIPPPTPASESNPRRDR